MKITAEGRFSIDVTGEELSRGIRPSKRAARNLAYLTESAGAVGIDGVIQAIEDLNEDRVDTSAITDSFPYPQIFTFTNLIIVCGESDIYELDSGSLTHMLGPVTAGGLWSAIDLFDFIYMSNGMVVVVRSAEDKTFSLSTDYPIASAICNYNGQVIIGGPEVNWV
jgi:hypothetical protein